MSLYGDYISERLGHHILEDENGFATYKYIDFQESKACYIIDLYIIPSKRRSKQSFRYVEEITHIAKKAGCRFLLSTVVPSANQSNISLSVMLSHGGKLINAQPDLIWFAKEI